MATAAENFMDRITRLPMAQKVAILVFVVAALTAGNWFMFISAQFDNFESEGKKMRGLEGDVIAAQAIATNLTQYRKEKELMEQQLQKALTELPEEADLEGLIKSLNDLGQKAGLTINSIEPGGEKSGGGDNLYNQIPLAMQVTGNFHEIAVFFDSVRQLKRIINVSGIKMTGPRIKNEKVLVDAAYTATAFRFNAPVKKEEKKDGKKDEKKDPPK
jgi:type IV pilus assembly protein PilO